MPFDQDFDISGEDDDFSEGAEADLSFEQILHRAIERIAYFATKRFAPEGEFSYRSAIRNLEIMLLPKINEKKEWKKKHKKLSDDLNAALDRKQLIKQAISLRKNEGRRTTGTQEDYINMAKEISLCSKYDNLYAFLIEFMDFRNWLIHREGIDIV
jgi:hypothetical protein